MTQPDQAALKARNNLFAMFLVLCLLDIILVAIAQDMWAIGRILVTIVVMYFVLQGRKWAKWTLMGLCSLLAVVLLAMVVALQSSLSTILIVGSLVMVVLSAIIVGYMARSADLNRYLAHVRPAHVR